LDEKKTLEKDEKYSHREKIMQKLTKVRTVNNENL
jgi:hypothetical protein